MPSDALTHCRALLTQSVRRNLGDAILLSGGLDTSIIAHLSVAADEKPTCYTVAFTEADAPDVAFARLVADRLGLKWRLVKLTPDLLAKRLPDVIRALRTFDPMEVRNSVAVYHGLVAASRGGSSTVMTGDAADELFAGYSFSFNLPPKELMGKLRALWSVMHFSSQPMAAALGLSASLPYLDPTVVSFAETLDPSQLVGARNGRKFGKLILRQAFERTVGRRIAWRVKTPIEYGSGTTSLPRFYEMKLSDEGFRDGRSRAESGDGVRIRDKEHLQYYSIYRELFPPPSTTAVTGCRCPDCGGDVLSGSTFCTTCGSYPITPVALP